MHLTFALEEQTPSAFISILGSKHQGLEHGSSPKLEFVKVRGTLRSSELCIIDYFFIAHNYLLMLYLRRSQINVPRDRR
jgi:hypothetical protein